MAIDIISEQLISLGEAAKHFAAVDGKRPSPNTVWRWCRLGVQGVTLEYVRVGRRICTTAAACNRFVNALAAADERPVKSDPKRVNISSRTKQHERAEAELAADGI